MTGLLEKIRDLKPREIASAAAGNRQFVALVAVLLLAVAFFPGEPAAPLLSGVGQGSQAPGAVLTQGSAGNPRSTGRSGGGTVGRALPQPGAPSGSSGDFAVPPPGDPPAPRPACSTDAVADIVNQVREPLSAAIGAQPPGHAIRDLAAIAAGCSDDDPTGPVLDLALEMAALVPDLGVQTVDLPDLPALPPLEAPPGVVEALGPIAEEIRSGCGTLSLVAVVLAILPPAANLPVSGSDLAQFAAPVSAFCGLFDEGAG